MKILKNNKGITLVALVITIIIMLILVAVTIYLVINGGLFEYSKNATSQTKEALEREQAELGNVQAGLTTEELREALTTTN